jgi:hypothetical protein
MVVPRIFVRRAKRMATLSCIRSEIPGESSLHKDQDTRAELSSVETTMRGHRHTEQYLATDTGLVCFHQK